MTERKDYELPGGRDDVPSRLATLKGKTIDSIEYGIDRDASINQSDAMTIHFTDGTALEIRLGTNAGTLGHDMRKLNLDMMIFVRQ
jgi:hypothetical protein